VSSGSGPGLTGVSQKTHGTSDAGFLDIDGDGEKQIFGVLKVNGF
jgi:hypothetical protein